MDNNHETGTLQHHGVKGQKWGVRRYQNKDGSLTALGEKRMGVKPGVDKKLREDLKDRRAARLMSLKKQRQDLRQERLDRENNRAIERAKIKLAKKKAEDESADQATNRKLIKEKLKQEKAAQKQDALDKAANRKLAKDAAKKDNTQTLPDEEYYELPDTPERQKSSGVSGKQMAGVALGIVGGVAVAAAVKKYGPSIMSKLKSIDWSKAGKAAKDAAKTATDNSDAYKDFALEVFKEASKAAGKTTTSNSSTAHAFSSALSSIGDIPLLAAPNTD